MLRGPQAPNGVQAMVGSQRKDWIFLILWGALACPAPVGAQCMLMNPSFEISGSSGAVFAGWNQFGVVGSSTAASHGSVAARVSGPNTGSWDVSGYWQGLDSAPGDTWKVMGTVRVPSARPLAGQSTAIVNVEWRTAAGALISYESHNVADANSLRDTALAFSFTSSAAPSGTASARLLLGVLQGPGDAQRDAIFDQVRFEKQTVPSIEAIQWNDFPGGRTLSFASRTWRVKGPGYYGPGPSSFSDSPKAIWVDADGALHLTISSVANNWYSTEVALVDSLGYGDYVFTTRGRLDLLDPNAVLGLYIWEYGPCYDSAFLWWNPFNEADVELSRWGVPGSPVEQFVVQPSDWGGNRLRFDVTFGDSELTSHAFRWTPDEIDFRAWRGGAADESPASLITSWTYTGPHIPRPDRPRVHFNLWQFNGPPASPQEVVIDDFRFMPWPAAVLAVTGPAPPSRHIALSLASSNPSSGGVTLRCVIPCAGAARLEVFDVAGRRVRMLSEAQLGAGAHELRWDGRDESGARLPQGLYLFRFDSGGLQAAARVVLLR
jgi:flagellar hook capping protein FlgD